MVFRFVLISTFLFLFSQNSSAQVHKKLFTSTNTAADIDSNMSYVGNWTWGECWAISADSNFVMIENGSLLQFICWRARTQPPSIIAEYEIGAPSCIKLIDSIAYVAVGTSLLILNVKDPLNVSTIGSVQTTLYISRMEIVNSLIYAISVDGALSIIDISDRTTPRVRSKGWFINEYCYTLAVKDGYCYVGGGSIPMLYVIDARNPDTLIYVTAWSPGFMDAAVVLDTFLILSKWTSALDYFSISNPAHPHYLYTFGPIEGEVTGANDFALSGSHLYMTMHRGIYDIDLTIPDQPVILAHNVLPYQTNIQGFLALSSNGLLYESCLTGFTCYDTKDSLRRLGFFPTNDNINNISIRGNLAATASNDAGLWLLDITDKYTPKQIVNINNDGYTNDAIINGNLLVTLDAPSSDPLSGGVFFYDISDSLHPHQLSALPGIAGLNMFLYNTLLFINEVTALRMVDISNISQPRQVGSVSTPFTITSFGYRDSIMYLGSRDSGLYIYDIHSLNNIFLSGRILKSIPETISSITLRDSILYIYSTAGGIYVYDISNAASPDLISLFSDGPNMNPANMPVTGNYLYYTGFSNIQNTIYPTIEAVDLSNLSSMRIRAFYTMTNWDGNLLDAANGYIFLNSGAALVILKNDLILGVKLQNQSMNNYNYRLEQNYPNPFNPVTTINFYLPHADQVEIAIYNILGEKVTLLTNEKLNPGNHSINFDASGLASGVYFCQLQTSSFRDVKKMVLIR
ncbi:MAG: T9SS type A sorting domain-containing protein [Bacteroidota bacterium]